MCVRARVLRNRRIAQVQLSEQELAEMDDEALMAALGLPGAFDSTQNKQVAGNDVSAVKVTKKRQYRQYMNVRQKQKKGTMPSSKR